MKIIVYAICKMKANLSTAGWILVTEADAVVVLDTGSSDDTVENCADVARPLEQAEILPWRFDTARNRSLALVPDDADICVCTDLDEVFHPGWRAAWEAAWTPGTQQARYRYTWSFRPDGSEGVVFWYEKIHSRHGWQWTHPVHEVLQRTDDLRQIRTVTAAGVQLDHHPDDTKSRGQYLPLLELSVKEAPEDDRNVHYLGREYFFYGRWDDCIATFQRHLAMPTATWADERSASMRYIAKSYVPKATFSLPAAIFCEPSPKRPICGRGTWIWLLFSTSRKTGPAYFIFTACALEITARPDTYICEAAAWGPLPHDLRAIAFHRLGQIPPGTARSRSRSGSCAFRPTAAGGTLLLRRAAAAARSSKSESGPLHAGRPCSRWLRNCCSQRAFNRLP